MRATADFVVRAVSHEPLLVVEVKTKTGAGQAWAASLRRNLFSHAQIPPAQFFLLALPDRFYLWKDAGLDAAPPDFDVDAAEVLDPYARDLQTPIASLSPVGFELLVQTWLDDVVSGNKEHWSKTLATSQLVQSGLYDAIRGGLIETGIAA